MRRYEQSGILIIRDAIEDDANHSVPFCDPFLVPVMKIFVFFAAALVLKIVAYRLSAPF
jgi:hypothetical protein